jgi:ABC-type branched-subunit amino acid transport system ATPase component
MTEPLLSVQGLGKSFGGVRAVDNVSFEVGAERIVGLIGPNGSGKSTLINLVSGVLQADCGQVLFRGLPILGRKPHQVFREGLNRTFQSTRIFPGFTVLENMQISAWNQGLPDTVAAEQLASLGLEKLVQHEARQLSYGDRKLLELGMSLIGNPALVLLDEPLAGVHRAVVERVAEIVRTASNITFVIVEHNVPFIMATCERIIVLNHGQLLADGRPDVVRNNPQVIEAYLGSDQF